MALGISFERVTHSPRSLPVAVAVAVLLSACVGVRPSPAPTPVAADTIFYISARDREAGRDVARLAASLEYGLAITAHPSRIDSLAGRIGFELIDSVRLTRDEFAGLLRARTVTKSQEDSTAFMVLYTHGYGTSLHEAWEHSATSRARARGAQPWVVFAWPSIGSGVAMPRDGELFLTAYHRDSSAAASSRGAYAEALSTVVAAVGGLRVLLIAHSLGGQLVGEALSQDTELRATLERDPLRAIAFVSPDIAATHFGDVIVPAMRPLTQRLLLYASADDRVLGVSQMVNDSERAGRIANTSRGPTVRPGLESVDMTDGAFADSRLTHAFGTRHALRRKSAVLFDLVYIVGGRADAHCRETLGTATKLPTGAWRLTARELPPVAAIARCEATGRAAP